MRRTGRLWLGTALVALVCGAGTASADALSDAYAAVLANPTSAEANLAYAAVAEQAGEYERALAAYERVLINNPDNAAALAGLQRVRLILQPPIQTFFAEFGGRWESNPLRLAPSFDPDPEWVSFADIRFTDERTLGEALRWRTAVWVQGDLHTENHDLHYGEIGGLTGPVHQIGTRLTMHTAIGGVASTFQDQLYFTELNGSATFRWLHDTAVQSVRLRAGYRWYGESFVTDGGYYLDAIGNFVIADLLVDKSALLFTPWVRYSDIGGSIADFNEFPETISAPGQYTEAGVRVGIDLPVGESVTIGGGLAASWRFFDTLAAMSTEKREDLFLQPDAFVSFNDVFGADGLDLKLAYRYQWRDSNSDESDFSSHLFTTSLVYNR
jgi:hypothetical protein